MSRKKVSRKRRPRRERSNIQLLELSFAVLERGEELGDEWTGECVIDDQTILFTASRMGASIEELVKFSEEVVLKFEVLSARALKSLADDMLVLYNDDWRDDGDEVADGKGGWIIMTSPVLSEAEFIEKFTIESISILDTDTIYIGYGPSDLFLGHHVDTCFRDGLNMTSVSSQMAGQKPEVFFWRPYTGDGLMLLVDLEPVGQIFRPIAPRQVSK